MIGPRKLTDPTQRVVIPVTIRHGQFVPFYGGHRLDAWVAAGRKLYQVEVKNWCAHSMNEWTVPDDALSVRKIAEKNLREFLTHPPNS